MAGQPAPPPQAHNDLTSQDDTTETETHHMPTSNESLPWRRFCVGNTDSDGTEESCVEFAEHGTTVILRNSNDPGAATLEFTQAEITSFVQGWIRK